MLLLECLSYLTGRDVVHTISYSENKYSFMDCKTRYRDELKNFILNQIIEKLKCKLKEKYPKFKSIYVQIILNDKKYQEYTCFIDHENLEFSCYIDCPKKKLLFALQRVDDIKVTDFKSSVTDLFKVLKDTYHYGDTKKLRKAYLEYQKNFLITQNGYLFYMDINHHFAIMATPPNGTVFENSEQDEKVEIQEGKIIVSQKMLVKQVLQDLSDQKKVKYVFVHSQAEMLTKGSISSILADNGNRIITHKEEIVWIDDTTKDIHISRISSEKQTFFDEATKMDVTFYKGKIHPKDPKAKCAINHGGGEVDYMLNYNVQYSIDFFPDGEYKDCINGKIFDMENGFVKDKCRYWVYSSLTDKEIEEKLKDLSSLYYGKVYLISESKLKMYRQNIDTILIILIYDGFTIFDQITQKTIIFNNTIAVK